jgi:hypothetical protein
VKYFYEGTNLILNAWKHLLKRHPNQTEVSLLKTLIGIEFGEALGFTGLRKIVISPSPHNLDSESVKAISENILKRLKR